MSLESIYRAVRLNSELVHKTVVFTSSRCDQLTGRKVFFKAENLQKTGSFKARGALNAVRAAKETHKDIVGVVTHSSGNHGQAVAWAARLGGLPCTVVVPKDTDAVKINAIRSYGAELVLCESTPQSRIETCQKIAEETGRIIIPPYDSYDVISGQGTIGVEFLQQCPYLDAILVPVSGGGLISGIAIGAKAINPNIKIFAVEAEGKMLESCLKAGERLWPDPPQFIDTIADGIKTQQLGRMTWPIVLDLVEKEVFTVNNAQITEAMKFVFQHMKLVVEGAAASGVAAVMSERMHTLDIRCQNIGVILTGGNVDIEHLPWYNNISDHINSSEVPEVNEIKSEILTE